MNNRWEQVTETVCYAAMSDNAKVERWHMSIIHVQCNVQISAHAIDDE